MKVTTTWHGKVLVAALSGEIDTIDSDGMAQALETVAHADAAGVVLDFAKVSYIASLGVGMLMQVAREIRGRSIRVRIAAASPEVHAVLHAVRISTIIPLDKTVGDAIAQLTKEPQPVA
jgi:anti-anti-sigma factor